MKTLSARMHAIAAQLDDLRARLSLHALARAVQALERRNAELDSLAAMHDNPPPIIVGQQENADDDREGR